MTNALRDIATHQQNKRNSIFKQIEPDPLGFIPGTQGGRSSEKLTGQHINTFKEERHLIAFVGVGRPLTN
jgi:hypothetical protein